MIVEGLLFVAIVIGVLYIVLGYTLYKPDYNTTQLYPLNVRTSVQGLSGRWNTQEKHTISFFVLINNISRSPQDLDCTAGSFIPGCDRVSKDETHRCSNSCETELNAIRNSYLKSIVGIGPGSTRTNLDFFIQGAVSSGSQSKVPAYITIRTERKENNSTAYYLEGISLPAIPLQRWTMVTITKQTKRIDVYYNKSRVASHLLKYLPSTSSDQNSPLSIGNEDVKGVIAYFNTVNDTAMTSDEISSKYDRLTNTKGVPRMLDTLDLKWDQPVSFCMFGQCNPLPLVAPSSPFVVWDTANL